ncbi:MAG: hypothetical protein M3Q30_27225 [Actinomycetota bacterium]|nr:hypothetical protein [Actinomycetota bacterium]
MVKRLVATNDERREVCRAALAGIAAESLDDVTVELRPRKDRHFPFPADVFIELGADALRLAGATRASPVNLNDFSERYLAEYELRGNTARQKIAAAAHLVVAAHGGVVPDYFGAAGWWQVQDLWSFALLALVGMVRVAAERTGRPCTDICAELAAAHDFSV